MPKSISTERNAPANPRKRSRSAAKNTNGTMSNVSHATDNMQTPRQKAITGCIDNQSSPPRKKQN